MDHCVSELPQGMPSPLLPFRIAPQIEKVALCNAIAVGSDKDWEFLFHLYINTTEEQDGLHLVHAMSCSRDPWILNRWDDQLTVNILPGEA